MREAPRGVLPAAWERKAYAEADPPDRSAYTFGILEELQRAMRRRSVYVEGSQRWGDPRAKLLQGSEAVKPQLCRAIGRTPRSAGELGDLKEELSPIPFNRFGF